MSPWWSSWLSISTQTNSVYHGFCWPHKSLGPDCWWCTDNTKGWIDNLQTTKWKWAGISISQTWPSEYERDWSIHPSVLTRERLSHRPTRFQILLIGKIFVMTSSFLKWNAAVDQRLGKVIHQALPSPSLYACPAHRKHNPKGSGNQSR